MSPLQILSEQINDATVVVTIIGQMDESNADANAPQIYEIIEKIPSEGNLILNFSGLEYMNSKSIGYTTDFYNKMTEKNGKLVIAEAQEQILDILNVVGLSNVVPLVSSIKEAKETLGVSETDSIANPTDIAMQTIESESKQESPRPVNPAQAQNIELNIKTQENIESKDNKEQEEDTSSEAIQPKIEINIPMLKPTEESTEQEKPENNSENPMAQPAEQENKMNTETESNNKDTQMSSPQEEMPKDKITNPTPEQASVEQINPEETLSNTPDSNNTHTPTEDPIEKSTETAPSPSPIPPANAAQQGQSTPAQTEEDEGGIPILSIAIVISVILVLIVLFVK